MKSLYILACLLIATLSLSAQTFYMAATDEQKRQLTKKITAASEQMKTLRCNFTQRKTISILADEMLSEGVLWYKQSDKLKWEYTKPYVYRFVMNSDKVLIDSEKSKNVIDVNSSKVFKEVSKIIISSINGSGIFDRKKYDLQFKIGAKDYLVIMTPLQKDMKQMFATISLYFNTADYTVDSVVIEEQSGDKTFIRMQNKQINKSIADEVFSIH